MPFGLVVPRYVRPEIGIGSKAVFTLQSDVVGAARRQPAFCGKTFASKPQTGEIDDRLRRMSPHDIDIFADAHNPVTGPVDIRILLYRKGSCDDLDIMLEVECGRFIIVDRNRKRRRLHEIFVFSLRSKIERPLVRSGNKFHHHRRVIGENGRRADKTQMIVGHVADKCRLARPAAAKTGFGRDKYGSAPEHELPRRDKPGIIRRKRDQAGVNRLEHTCTGNLCA